MFKLELQQPDTMDRDHIFYRYRYKNFLIWFSQCQKTGNIYMVSVARDEEADIPYRVYSDSRKKFYPTDFEVVLNSVRLHNIFECDIVSEVLAEVKDLIFQLYYFFESSDHAKLYCKLHGVTKIFE